MAKGKGVMTKGKRKNSKTLQCLFIFVGIIETSLQISNYYQLPPAPPPPKLPPPNPPKPPPPKPPDPPEKSFQWL